MATTEGAHKVQSDSEERGIEAQNLPPQHHAGQVGYGPNYNLEPTIQEKIKGLKEELEGKVKHDPELVRHGHGILSGEEKLKKLTGEDRPNPFQSAKENKSPVPGLPSPEAKQQPEAVTPGCSNNADIQRSGHGELIEGGKNIGE